MEAREVEAKEGGVGFGSKRVRWRGGGKGGWGQRGGGGAGGGSM